MKLFFVWIGYLHSIGYGLNDAVWINIDESQGPSQTDKQTYRQTETDRQTDRHMLELNFKA